MASIYRRRGREGWTVSWYEPGVGRTTRGFALKREAVDFEERLRARLLRGEGLAPDESLRHYAGRWLDAVAPHIRAGTLRQYGWALDRHILPALGDQTLRAITPARVRDLLAACLGGGLAKKTVRNIQGVLQVMLGEALAVDGIIAVNPAAAPARGRSRTLRLGSTQAERRAKVKALDAAQLGRFLEQARETEPTYALLWRVAASTGLRPGESLALQWDDLDVPERRLLIRRGWTAARRLEPTKTAHERYVDLAAGVLAELQAHDTATKAAALARGEPRPAWMFPARGGKHPHDHSENLRAFARTLKTAGLPPHHTPHGLRHTYASLLLAAGESIQYVQRQLGHASITMTVDLYGSWLPAGNPAAADRLEARIAEATEAKAKAVLGSTLAARATNRTTSGPA